jgi:hypothetical protein
MAASRCLIRPRWPTSTWQSDAGVACYKELPLSELLKGSFV